MSSIIKIAVDAMGGDNSPNKIIDGIVHHYSSNNQLFIKYLVIKIKFKVFEK
jgi:glycerol-3-phosphate acyltransferase PlsX